MIVGVGVDVTSVRVVDFPHHVPGPVVFDR
ncbi:MAG: hypothetical protein RLZZ01_2575 [Actinomycetota bacterium]